jgi:hypothetical protein
MINYSSLLTALVLSDFELFLNVLLVKIQDFVPITKIYAHFVYNFERN